MIDWLQTTQSAYFFKKKTNLPKKEIASAFREIRSGLDTATNRNVFLHIKEPLGQANWSAISFYFERTPSFLHDLPPNYMKERILSGRSKDMSCPEIGCKRLLNAKEVGRTVDKNLHDKYMTFLLEAHLKTDPDCRWCPKPGCGMAMIGNKDHPMMRCPNDKCKYCFCFNCRVDWHADSTCEKYQLWVQENKAADNKFEEWRKQNTKLCPKCKAPIQKNGGCNHMTCVSCRYEFCWLCFIPYKAGHFSLDEKSPCYGKQYT